jgi:hypothetical protein
MIFLGMWACQWRELRPITFGGGSVSRAKETPALPNENGDNEERGFMSILGRGRGRGRERDGAGDYEMVAMEGEGHV